MDLTPPPPSGSSIDVDARPPPDGVGTLVTGGVFAGLAFVNVVTTPLCVLFAGSGGNLETDCIAGSLVVAGAFAAVGVPMLIVGANQYARFVGWHGQNPWLGLLESVDVELRQGGATLGLRLAL